jgi:membrane-associated HD superfamily phosphohydrolase
MKAPKNLLLVVFILLGVASFFLPNKSYYPSFIFTSNNRVFEHLADNFGRWSIVAKLCFSVVFAPAAALIVLQTRLVKNVTGLLIISLILSAMLYSAGFAMTFGIFEAQTKLLSGYFLFMALGSFGCLMFWILTTGGKFGVEFKIGDIS